MNKPALVAAVLGGFILMAAFIHAEDGKRAPAGPAPAVITLDGIMQHYGPVAFDHAKHVMMEPDCARCHHQHPETAALSCSECHAIGSREYRQSVVGVFTACRTCHGTYAIANPAMPDLKVAYHQACFECHRGMGSLGAGPGGCIETCHARRTDATVAGHRAGAARK